MQRIWLSCKNLRVSGVMLPLRIFRLSLLRPQPVALSILNTGMRISSRIEGTPNTRTSPDWPPELNA